ncbi:MAG: sn-glycerol-3-phosphate ABC transporter ATP-binding protein UgpC [Rhodobacteraceae bacterium]|nr:sn-glycerol-3-phosphate ABC transporter ATP-binding protein UgpC [Paracoccaceae bacterium]
MTPVLELAGLRKSFGSVAVIHGVDLKINAGEFVVFVGPSGCGKSTLLRLIAGLDTPSSGDILLNGVRVNQVPAADRGLSMVFQSYALYPHMSVKKNLSFGLENLRVARPEIERRIAHAAKLLQIEMLLDRRPGQLSGGQRQRVAIGRSIVREPILFLFDEPLSNLDAELRLQMRVELADLHAALGNTMIYVTHDQTEAMTMADRIVVLRAGRIEQIGAPLALYNAPANRFVAGFIGAPQMNFLQGCRADSGLVVAGAPVPVSFSAEGVAQPLPQVVDIGIRPEAVEVLPDGEGATSATIESFEHLGALTYVYCRLPSQEPLTVQLAGQPRLARGQRVGVRFPPGALHLFDPASGRVLAVRAAPQCPPAPA